MTSTTILLRNLGASSRIVHSKLEGNKNMGYSNITGDRISRILYSALHAAMVISKQNGW